MQHFNWWAYCNYSCYLLQLFIFATRAVMFQIRQTVKCMGVLVTQQNCCYKNMCVGVGWLEL